MHSWNWCLSCFYMTFYTMKETNGKNKTQMLNENDKQQFKILLKIVVVCSRIFPNSRSCSIKHLIYYRRFRKETAIERTKTWFLEHLYSFKLPFLDAWYVSPFRNILFKKFNLLWLVFFLTMLFSNLKIVPLKIFRRCNLARLFFVKNYICSNDIRFLKRDIFSLPFFS